jgi:hypothetical protein
LNAIFSLVGWPLLAYISCKKLAVAIGNLLTDKSKKSWKELKIFIENNDDEGGKTKSIGPI